METKPEDREYSLYFRSSEPHETFHELVWVLSIQEEAQLHLNVITVKVIMIVTVLNQAGGWNVQVTCLGKM